MLKYNELSSEQNPLPVCIVIESYKNDFDQFNMLLCYIYQKYIIGNISHASYQKIELINILFFITSCLYKPSPHTIISLNLPFFPKDAAIEFYYSSNMEVPCNKTDSCISILFDYLDLSIIIQIVFKLLAERSVVLLGSESSTLNSIVHALRTLIFPIKWLYRCYPVLPEEYLSKLQNAERKENTLLVGVISKNKDNINLKNFAKKQFAVDCDINEIFSDKKYVDFCFLPSSDFVNKPRVYLELFNKKLYQVIPNERCRTKITFLKQGKVIIDCEQDNRLLTEHNDNYLSHEESTMFRRKIQKLRQHNLFQTNNELSLESFHTSVYYTENTQTERSFEYQLKKLFMELIISKIKPNDPLFEDMKRYNIYKNYINVGSLDNYAPINIAKKVMNNSQDSERCFTNAFKVNFHIHTLENNEKNKNIFGYNNQSIFNDYLRTSEELKKNKYGTWNFSTLGNVKDDIVVKFYGQDGFLALLNDVLSNISEDKLDSFLMEEYSSQVLQYIFKDLEEKNLFPLDISDSEEEIISIKEKPQKQVNYAISFDNSDLDEIPQYLNYMAILFDEFRISSLESDVAPPLLEKNEKEIEINKANKNRYCIQNILEKYNAAHKLDKHDQVDFPYWKLSQVLESLNIVDFMEANECVKGMDPHIVMVYEEIKQRKIEEEEKKNVNVNKGEENNQEQNK